MKIRRIGTIVVILMAYRRGLIEDLVAVLKQANERAFQINERVFNRLKKRANR